MPRFPDSLRATDQIVPAMGCSGRHPTFCTAIEAQSRFPARRAGPRIGLGLFPDRQRPFPVRPDARRQA